MNYNKYSEEKGKVLYENCGGINCILGKGLSTGFSEKVEVLRQAKEKGKGWSTPSIGKNHFIQKFLATLLKTGLFCNVNYHLTRQTDFHKDFLC